VNVVNLQNTGTKPPSEIGLPLHNLASCLAQLLATARRELESDREAAKGSPDTAPHILQSEIKRHLGADASRLGSSTGSQGSRVCAFIDVCAHLSRRISPQCRYEGFQFRDHAEDGYLRHSARGSRRGGGGYFRRLRARLSVVIDAVVNRTELAMSFSVAPEMPRGSPSTWSRPS
jgi:hypothetical protein